MGGCQWEEIAISPARLVTIGRIVASRRILLAQIVQNMVPTTVEKPCLSWRERCVVRGSPDPAPLPLKSHVLPGGNDPLVSKSLCLGPSRCVVNDIVINAGA